MVGKLAEAQANAEMGLEKAGDVRAKTSACEVLVRIALARKDPAAARRYAAPPSRRAPDFPLPDYVEGLILHADKRFEEALPHFQAAIVKLRGQQVTIPELFFIHGRHAGEPGTRRRGGGGVQARAGVLANAPAHEGEPGDALPRRRPHTRTPRENSTR